MYLQNTSIDSFSQSRAALVCPDSGKDLYPIGLSLTKPEHDIKWEGASTFCTLQGGKDMRTSESSRQMVYTLYCPRAFR